MSRKITYVQAVNEALHTAMQIDPTVICYGLGVDDPKRIFTTTNNLIEKFGPERVFDMPTAENAMTGIAIGAAIDGLKPVMVHQRLDFFLLALDQLVNNAAKWHYTFAGQASVPITIRLIIGHGWGQGPTHSQNLHAWFAHVPGLKVVIPTTPAEAKGLLLSSIFDPNPVIFIEHRWLHNIEGEVPEGDYRLPIGRARKVHDGKDVTMVSLSYMTVEAIHAIDFLEKQGITVDLIELTSLQPVDWPAVYASVKKTGRLVALDTSQATGSFAGEVISRVTTEMFSSLKSAPVRIAQPDFPSPTSVAMTKGFYKRAEHIVQEVGKMFGKEFNVAPLIEARKVPHDVPGDWFKGPF